MRAKYPGAYDDMSDADLEKAVVAKYPEYQDLATKTPPSEHASTMSRISEGFQRTFHPIDALTGAAEGAWNTIRHPVDTAVGVGKSLANESERLNTLAQQGNEGTSALNWVPFVGPQLAHAAETIRGGNVAGGLAETAGTVATNEVVPATLREAGRVLRGVAAPVMEGALRINAPIARKFGRDKIGRVAVDERIMPTKAGATKAGELINATVAEKEAGLQAAGQRASILPKGILADAFKDVTPGYHQQRMGGGGSGMADFELARNFYNEHPRGISPSDLNQAKVYWDDISDAAHRALPTGGRLGVEERLPMAMAKSAKRTLEEVAPGTNDLNQRIMGLKGAQLGARGRADIPAGGLDNIAAGYGVTAAMATGSPKTAMAIAAARAARDPRVMAGGAIGLNELGKLLQRGGSGLPAQLQRAITLMFLQGKQP
jgi:hypothetical protein